MYKLAHYFTPFQSYLVQQAEQETGRFTMETAFQVLEAEAKYRMEGATPAGLFFFQFEVLCRNRLNYDKGLTAISGDPVFDAEWAKWILMLRAQVGLVDMADLLFLASEEYKVRLIDAGESTRRKRTILVRAKRGANRSWQSQEGSPLSVRRNAASPGLSASAEAEAARRNKRS